MIAHKSALLVHVLRIDEEIDDDVSRLVWALGFSLAISKTPGLLPKKFHFFTPNVPLG